ncbi:hypothetical protein [Microseira wollei]|uniref:Uncharacterized protein n=1 Tax=Microseira wollei NIES-4236 TaxID=2530354 RepID=A0AAV3WF24_9CYAN|nr:hypothetical protein [Microseira wollei]GET36174.1 hypothetical protein MiSe_09220 [Microseira wollei NIES-4236]
MNTEPRDKDAYPGNLFTGGNSAPANPNGYNGSPLAASLMARLIAIARFRNLSTVLEFKQ